MVQYELSPSDPTPSTFKIRNVEWLQCRSNNLSVETVSSRDRCGLGSCRKARVFRHSFGQERTRLEGELVEGTERGNFDTGSRFIGIGTLPDVLTGQPLQTQEPPKHSRNLSSRTVHKIETSPILFPITDLHTAETLLPAIKDVFYSHRQLYEQAKVLHGDITRRNLRYTKSDNGTTQGVLIDFDLAIPQPEWTSGPRPKFRDPTPSQSYLATDRHMDNYTGPVPLMYRHDLESLLFAILVITTLFERGRIRVQLEHPPGTHQYVARQKTRPMYDLFKQDKPRDLFVTKRCGHWMPPGFQRPKLTEDYGDASRTVEVLNWLFVSGYAAKQSESIRARKLSMGCLADSPEIPYDEETMGGEVTADKFQHVLETGKFPCIDDPDDQSTTSE